MKYFDLHCDTALSVWKNNETIFENSCHISLKKTAGFEKYIQLTAIFTSPSLSDSEGWKQFLWVYDKLISDARENNVQIIRSREDLMQFYRSPQKTAFIISIEDVRIIDGHLERIKELFDRGIRVITPVWGGVSSIGGAHGHDTGLTKLGRDAVRAMAECGIIPDISHASRITAGEIMDICEEYGVSPIATHSNSCTVRDHTRNLTDEEFIRLTKLGGIAGISLCPPHLSAEENGAIPDDVIPHILKYEMLCPAHVSFGCDFDGTDLPHGIDGIEYIPSFAEKFADAGISPSDSKKIFFDTAYQFFAKNLP
ncbi:MAG: hypothetical protein E7672_01145 [Ruminococcaceae bacterium]|nr:hypothetical protein [Oscillospiraceae bacterium]